MDVACEAAGLPCKSYKDFASHVEWEQYNNRRWTITFAQDNEWEREQEEEKITRVRVWDCIHERMWPILEEILSLKATTLAGLAVQARRLRSRRANCGMTVLATTRGTSGSETSSSRSALSAASRRCRWMTARPDIIATARGGLACPALPNVVAHAGWANMGESSSRAVPAPFMAKNPLSPASAGFSFWTSRFLSEGISCDYPHPCTAAFCDVVVAYRLSVLANSTATTQGARNAR